MGSIDFDYENFDMFLSFSSFSIADIYNMVGGVIEWLDSQDLSDIKIPLLNKSAEEIIDFVAAFKEKVDSVIKFEHDEVIVLTGDNAAMSAEQSVFTAMGAGFDESIENKYLRIYFNNEQITCHQNQRQAAKRPSISNI